MRKSLPEWFNQRVPNAGEDKGADALLKSLKLHTICESGHCPNVSQCFPGGAAFLILGNICTRNCSFCAVHKGQPYAPDPDEPANIVEAARKLGINYIFITSVTRDDLSDNGAGQFVRTIEIIHKELPGVGVEVLVPDFKGDQSAVKAVMKAGPEVIGHNLETVPRLYPLVRPMADYKRSLDLLRLSKEVNTQAVTKSGIMLGLGETREEVIEVMHDLRRIDCDLLTFGQYLAPSLEHYPIINFPTPQEFYEYIPLGIEMGFRGIASAPLMRSSFKADELYKKAILGYA
ncbi:MAG: lipoyl synthase [Dehalococcoidia bacterium]|nr:MAG: lipoyl synthase [Dehalococcoidia bacterium]